MKLMLIGIQEQSSPNSCEISLKLIQFKIKSKENHEAIPWSVDLFNQLLLLIGVAPSKSLVAPYLFLLRRILNQNAYDKSFMSQPE